MSSGSSEGVSEGIAFRSMFSFLQRKGKAAGYKLHKMCHDKGLRNFLFHKLDSLTISACLSISDRIQVAHF